MGMRGRRIRIVDNNICPRKLWERKESRRPYAASEDYLTPWIKGFVSDLVEAGIICPIKQLIMLRQRKPYIYGFPTYGLLFAQSISSAENMP